MKLGGFQVVVIGAGVIGLTTAVELLRRGARVRVLARDLDVPPASSVAPAMFTPYPGPAPDRLKRWTVRSFHRLRELATTAPESGISMGNLREYCYERRTTKPWMADLLGITRLPRGEPFAEVTDSVRPHIDMRRFMPWLRERVTALGGRLEASTVTTLEDVTSMAGGQCVVNCSGLGARDLAADRLVCPMHGQVLHVPNDIGLTYSLHDDAPGGLVAYVFRYADHLVVGGTFEDGRTDGQTDEGSLGAILERARGLLRADDHPRWSDLGRTVIEARGAARPARGSGTTYEDVRLEACDDASGRRVVHNYGHGRMGVTLAWATAEEAAELALQAHTRR